MDPYLLGNLLIAAALVLIGLLVLLKNRKNTLNRNLFWLTLFLASWIVSNYYSNDFTLSPAAALTANHLVMVTGAMALVLLTRFIVVISKNSFLNKYSNSYSALATLGALSALTPYVVEDITPQQQVYAIDFGPLAWFYFFSIALSVVLMFWALIAGYHQSRGLDRARLVIIAWSFGLFILFAVFTNAALPFLAGEFELTELGPLATVILVLGLAYTIVRHRLFDIKLVVARSLAYLLLLVTLAGLYGLAIFSATAILFEDTPVGNVQNLVYVGLAVVLAFTFQPLRRFFERLTDRLFYRDRYDSQEVINHIGQVLASELQLDKLLEKSLEVLCGNLRVVRGQFVVFNKGKIYQVVHYGPVPDKPLKQSELEELGHGMLVADELEDGNSRKGLLAVHDVRLSLPLKTHEELVGYLLLGDKQSGTIYTNQDIELLGVVDNELAVGIQNTKAYEEIRKFNLTLQRKIEEATTQLRASNKKLKKLDEAKDEFISMASHQLRTPLTTIKGYLSMLLEGDAGQVSEKQQKFIDMAYSGSERMVYLITDLLNVSRMSTGKFIIERSAFDLAQLVKDEVEQLRRYADGKDVALVYEPPTDLPKVHLDENKTRQVVMNLIDNAIYYTPGGGQVTVALKEEGGYIEFKVRDTGIGVPKAEQEKLFSKFFRATNAQKARAEGTGLGLFMVKKVVEGQGGEVLFESTEGKGSTFGFRLKTQVATQAAQATEEVTVEKAADI